MEHEFLSLFEVISVVLSIGTASVLAASLLTNKQSLQNNTDARYTDLVIELDQEIISHEKSISNISSSYQCKDFARHYINIHNRIATLADDKALTKKYLDDFNYSFNTAYTLYLWLEKIMTFEFEFYGNSNQDLIEHVHSEEKPTDNEDQDKDVDTKIGEMMLNEWKQFKDYCKTISIPTPKEDIQTTNPKETKITEKHPDYDYPITLDREMIIRIHKRYRRYKDDEIDEEIKECEEHIKANDSHPSNNAETKFKDKKKKLDKEHHALNAFKLKLPPI